MEKLLADFQTLVLAYAPDAIYPALKQIPPIAFAAASAGLSLFIVWSFFAALTRLFGGGRRREQYDYDDNVVRYDHRAMPPPNPHAGAQAYDREQDEPAAFRRPVERRAAAFAAEPQFAPAPPPMAPPPQPPADDRVARYEAVMDDGDAAAYAGDPQRALHQFREALDLARQLALPEPDNALAQRRVAKALLKGGDAVARIGDAAASRQWHDQALALLRRLYATQAGDIGLAREYAVTLERAGAGAAASGDKVAARQAFEEELRVVGGISHQYPNDPQWGRFRAVIHVMLGNLGEYDSRSHYEQARALFDSLERAGIIQQNDAQTLHQLRSVLTA